ncbi:hypothetical protein GCM10011490_01490 [Pseudoclavibacter endophyticus]|uniref:Uncharacterized protein n=1 Tax=Pseudoclavibacter endophyticus TaxID=1778590 RepID=A0A6H9WRQ7_9MICO|nr:hypothetical protein [Pseudoclavibacter endophyticus]KAB1650301.1 hypothetical protein F8O04_08955 [Pseudoclavibacter endophyticus]GGA55320.1 hypothetical protein GCM10011490_01490 [Pseudoclavibacter endophyticus]
MRRHRTDHDAKRCTSAGRGSIGRGRDRSERGSAQAFLVLTVVTLIVVIGLVVDGAGKVQAATAAQQVAASAARAATNAISGDTVDGASLAVDPHLAEHAALEYLAAAGMTGVAVATGSTITVTTETTYETRFVSIIGIGVLTVTGEAEASLITGPDDLP